MCRRRTATVTLTFTEEESHITEKLRRHFREHELGIAFAKTRSGGATGDGRPHFWDMLSVKRSIRGLQQDSFGKNAFCVPVKNLETSQNVFRAPRFSFADYQAANKSRELTLNISAFLAGAYISAFVVSYHKLLRARL